MPLRNKAPTVTKASESVVSRMLAKILGTPQFDTIDEVTTCYYDQTTFESRLSDVIKKVRGLYPWVADVARDVMSDKTTPLTEHMMSMPCGLYVVKDTARPGADSLWLVAADPDNELINAIRKMPCRGLYHTFRVGDDTSMIIAIQLTSCQP